MAFQLPKIGSPESTTLVNGFTPCRLENCKECDASPNCVVAHHKCVRMWSGAYEAIFGTTNNCWAQLCEAGLAREPWPKAPVIDLKASETHLIGTVEEEMAQLPLVVQRAIRQRAAPEEFAKAIIVAKAVLALNEAIKNGQVSREFPLSQIRRWSRRGKPQLRGDAQVLFYKITIDFHGIRKVESLNELPASDSTASPSMSTAYCFIPHENAQETTAIVRVRIYAPFPSSPAAISDSMGRMAA